MEMKKQKKIIGGMILVLAVTACASFFKSAAEEIAQEETSEIYQNEIKTIYTEAYQDEVETQIEEEKSSGAYTEDNMLIKENPYGTNTLSLYVYFTTQEPVSVSYNVSVPDLSIGDFSQTPEGEGRFDTEHEFQVMGLIPEECNTITFTLTKEDGSVEIYSYVHEMGELSGKEEIQLKQTEAAEGSETVSDGLYVVLGNDSDEEDFMYYYDNSGVLRGEIPLIGYRSHRLLFRDDCMYYSISESKIAAVNHLGKAEKIYDTGTYSLHHDYVFDKNGNMLILATDTTQDSVEDIVLKLDVNSGEVTKVLDLGDLLGDYKKTCVRNSSDELDWMHINTIQYMGNGSVLLSSRETSTIIKVDNLYDEPSIAYMIGEKDFWEDTSYVSCLLNKKGDFTIQGGQHTITYETDESLADGQYYLYMFNNNIGISETRPDYDWSSIGLKTSSAVDEKNSKYYKYLVDENEGTFELVDSFKVPYSGYVSSAQDIGDNVLTDSGLKGTFTEYDEDHKAIATYKMDYEKFIYRVFKYNFEGFYFGKSE